MILRKALIEGLENYRTCTCSICERSEPYNYQQLGEYGILVSIPNNWRYIDGENTHMCSDCWAIKDIIE
jgi:hypothetical protein